MIKMLTMSSPMSASAIGSYHHKEDPFCGPGEWLGKLADRLNVKGDIDRKELIDVLNGRDPTGQPLREFGKTGSKDIAGFDMTFSAPKSVSIISIENDKIKNIHGKSVKDVMNFVEEKLILVRKSNRGIREINRSDNILAAKFDHMTSRENDPQLHSHVVVMNMTRYDDKILAVHNTEIYKNIKSVGKLYRNEMAVNLQNAGYQIEVKYMDDGFFEITGVSEGDIENFSKRSKKVDENIKLFDEKYSMNTKRIREIATLKSRPDKIDIDKDDILKSWENDLSVTTPKKISDNDMHNKNEISARESIDIACGKLIHFNEKDVLIKAIDDSFGQHSLEQLRSAFNDKLDDDEIKLLDNGIYISDDQFEELEGWKMDSELAKPDFIESDLDISDFILNGVESCDLDISDDIE
ncbi:MAG: relaxase domain-containing protein [bacterium]|nr:relaxase domain-containing protein [bacterium]